MNVYIWVIYIYEPIWWVIIMFKQKHGQTVVVNPHHIYDNYRYHHLSLFVYIYIILYRYLYIYIYTYHYGWCHLYKFTETLPRRALHGPFPGWLWWWRNNFEIRWKDGSKSDETTGRQNAVVSHLPMSEKKRVFQSVQKVCWCMCIYIYTTMS